MDKTMFFEKIQHLIELHKKQEDEADLRGENYNIFNVLGLTTNETQLHSAFIANLLDPKGKHGLREKPLREFLKVIHFHYYDNLTNEDLIRAEIVTEFHIGTINEDYTQGGNIDILIRIKDYVIVIENKIYAGDQNAQLLRYKNYCKKWQHQLIYLTLDGHEPSEDSQGHLIMDEDFSCIQYRKEIMQWLQKCLFAAISKPVVRETIQQYMNVIKQLTNNVMEKAELNNLYKTMAEYPEVVNAIQGNMWGYRRFLIENYLINPMKEWSKENGFEWYVDEDLITDSKWKGFGIYRPGWNKMVAILFERSEFREPYWGVRIWKSIDTMQNAGMGIKTNRDWPYGRQESEYNAFDESVATDLVDGRIFELVKNNFMAIIHIIESNPESYNML